MLEQMGINAKTASRQISGLSAKEKNEALKKIAGELKLQQDKILAANAEDVKKAKENGTTRAVASMERGMELYENAVFAIGNAPTALIRVAELIEEGARPSLVIGVPVGFVNVVESKEYALSVCEKFGVPGIFAMGRKGGSNVAATICNALLYTATDTVDPDKRGK